MDRRRFLKPPIIDGKYMLLTGFSELRLSSDFGQSWTTVQSLIEFHDISISASGQYMLAAARQSDGRRYSSDFGQTWSSMPHYNYQGYTVTNPRKCAISASGQYRLFSSDWILHLSSDFGVTWSNMSPQLNQPYSAITGIEISSSGQYIAISYFAEGVYDNGIMWSSDYGQTWTQVASCSHNIPDMSMTKDGQYLIFSMVNWEEYYLRPFLARVYNYGTSSQFLYDRELNTDADKYLVTSGDGSLFLKGGGYYNGVQKSTNQGASWSSPTSGTVTTFPSISGYFATNYKGNIIGLAYGRGSDSSLGVWISYDSGVTWQKTFADYSGRLITMNQSN